MSSSSGRLVAGARILRADNGAESSCEELHPTGQVTADQAFMTLAGWMALRDLNVGARIAVLRRVPEPSQPQRMADDEIVLLAHMIGDGSCVKNQPIRYASIDEENLRAVTRAPEHFGVTAKRDEYAAARVTTLRCRRRIT